jgi:hypothetical protein
MGANAQTSVPVFTAGQVLTAQQQTEINTGIPVFATTTTRDAAFGGTGEKTLAEGQMAYIENIAGSSAVQYYDGSAWQTLVTGGLTLIKTQTIGTGVSSVTVTGAFSSTYENYRVIVTEFATSGTGNVLRLRLAVGNTYSGTQLRYVNTSATTNNMAFTNDPAFYLGYSNTTKNNLVVDIFAPNLASQTSISAQQSGWSTGVGVYSSVTTATDSNAAAHTDFVLDSNTGTWTGGTVYVYGYAKS